MLVLLSGVSKQIDPQLCIIYKLAFSYYDFLWVTNSFKLGRKLIKESVLLFETRNYSKLGNSCLHRATCLSDNTV